MSVKDVFEEVKCGMVLYVVIINDWVVEVVMGLVLILLLFDFDIFLIGGVVLL